MDTRPEITPLVEAMLAEDDRRQAAQDANGLFDPVTGIGAPGERLTASDPFDTGRELLLPRSMIADPGYTAARRNKQAWERLRMHHDFAYWCWRCVQVRHKVTGLTGPLVLNAPQRRVTAMLEEDRAAGRPLRMIMLKARQWGGSTLVQMYFAWLQTVLCRNWHSIICAHVRDTSAAIRDLYGTMLSTYPDELWEGDEPPGLTGCGGSRSKQLIAGRGCTVTLGSSQSPDALRGHDFQLAHLSEVAFWQDSTLHDPESLVRTVCGSVPLRPMTAIVLESTANGVGNFFHDQWLLAESGATSYRPVFVPWYEIEHYRMERIGRNEASELIETMTAYERSLWSLGLTLCQIAWYRAKRREYGCDAAMQAEFPTTAVEAFARSGSGVFDPDRIEALRPGCRPPLKRGSMRTRTLRGPGALDVTGWDDDPNGPMAMWQEPVRGADYVVAVDIGGRSAGADWSVIAVLRRQGADGRPEVVAQWRGHEDHDLVGWHAAAIARHYNDALLVIESNSLETDRDDPSLYILGVLRDLYPNLYMRADPDTGMAWRPGFHTNRRTKQAVVTELLAAVRDADYVERDAAMLDELRTYERTPSGAYAAMRGHHDDILMTRAIGLYVVRTTEPPCRDPAPAKLYIPSW